MSRVRILGIGSPSGDDQAGWLTVDALLAAGVQHGDGVSIEKLDRPGAGLITHLGNASRVILIDAVQNGDQPGRIRRFDQKDWPTYGQGFSSHGFGVLDALLLARALGGMPPRLDLYGVEIGGVVQGAQPGTEVQAAALQLAAIIAAELVSGPKPDGLD
ncbi:MAG: hydrogenase maturation protease [Candidatus Thermoplasmatota archaeon]|nr:hydrogenase maturation protease [Candidatus Thermoplasmatota archaeon]